VCLVQSYKDGRDDAAFVLDAIQDCNDGGHVVFQKDVTYTIGTALDLTFLKHIDIGIHPLRLS
jgi:galacturan 1,4-alpha-galacturonidase